MLNDCRVIDGKPYPPLDAEHLVIAADARASLDRLKAAGFLLVCVTNQPDVARGTRTLENVEAMNAAVQAALPLDALYVCLHDRPDNCDCRKPKPGMLLEGARAFGLALDLCYMVGDRAGDIGAGKNAGCHTVFLDRGYAEPAPSPAADHTCNTLAQAADWILAHSGQNQ